MILELLLFLCQADDEFGDVLIWMPGTPSVLLQFFNHLFTERAPIILNMLDIVT